MPQKTVKEIFLFLILFQGRLEGSSDLYSTGSRIFKTIISNNFRVYNTRVKLIASQKGDSKIRTSRYIKYIINVRALQREKRQESCIAEKHVFAGFRASYFGGNRRTYILFKK